jgi:hypothetical protein
MIGREAVRIVSWSISHFVQNRALSLALAGGLADRNPMDMLGPDEQVIDWLGLAPVLKDFAKELVADLRPFSGSTGDQLKTVIAKLPGTEQTSNQDHARLRLCIARTLDLIDPFCSDLHQFFQMYPPGPRTQARIIEYGDYVQNSLSDEQVVQNARMVARGFANGGGFIPGLDLTGSTPLACFDVANDIATRAGTYKALRSVENAPTYGGLFS